jgi:hypothetical protein
MPIVGITVNERGESLQRLAITTKVAIGEVIKTGEKTRPHKLDHFVFLRKSNSFEWEPDPELATHFGAQCREFWIVLLDDELENVFRTEFAWWTKTEKKCWGDGREATRRTEKHPEGEPWTPCGDTCPDLAKRLCKPSGDLYFVLADFPKLGSVCRLHTTSYRSIRQIYSALEQIRTVTGGRLAGIRCKLVVRPEKASYLDVAERKKKSTTVYALNLELSAEDMRQLVAKMTSYANLFAQTRLALGEGHRVEYEEEPETERSEDVAREFYPEGEREQTASAETKAASPPLPSSPVPPQASGVRQPTRKPKAVTEPTAPRASSSPAVPPAIPASAGGLISKEQRQKLYEIIVEAGWAQDQVREILMKRFDIESTAKLPAAQFDAACALFERQWIQESLPEAEASGQTTEPYQATDEDLPENLFP